jgi:hypothetical protein
MNPKKALEVLQRFIEAANGAGIFKRLIELDTVRTAHRVLSDEINKKSKGDERNSGGK